MRIAYADPPYPGCAHLYRDHPDYAGEVDFVALALDLKQYDGWVLHTSSTGLPHVLACLGALQVTDYRIMAWVKPFAAFKRNVSVAYAWEPVIVKPARKPSVDAAKLRQPEIVMRDWLAESITMKRGLTGAKPERVCWWLFEMLGADSDDDFMDMYPGTGAVWDAWNAWCLRDLASSVVSGAQGTIS